eukprot:6183899-Pleurochrysis_carterae.AAC.1
MKGDVHMRLSFTMRSSVRLAPCILLKDGCPGAARLLLHSQGTRMEMQVWAHDETTSSSSD